VAVGCATTTPHSECPGPPNDLFKPPRWGTIPDYASALHDSEVRLGLDGAAVVGRSGEDDPTTETNEADPDGTDWMGSINILVRLSGVHWTAYLGGSGAVSTLTVENDKAQSAVLAGVGYRVNTPVGETHYRGFGLRLDAARGEHVDTDGKTDPYLSLRPLDDMRFGPGWRVQGIVELRYELMGCYAPFLHFSGGVRLGEEQEGTTLPFSFHVGAHREIGGDPYVVYGGLDLDVVRPEDVPDFDKRIRFGIETLNLFEAWKRRVRLDVFAEIIIGAVDGTYGGAVLAIPFSEDVE